MVKYSAEEIRRDILEVLTEVAPEIEGEQIDPDLDLREQFDIDSMDFLNFVIGLSKRFSLEIAESEYPQLLSLRQWIEYIQNRLK